jgi:hypothetical protein
MTLGERSIGDRAPSMIPLGQTLGWIINLMVAEWLVKRRSSAVDDQARSYGDDDQLRS